jgi:hypothetical protein
VLSMLRVTDICGVSERMVWVRETVRNLRNIEEHAGIYVPDPHE